MRSQSQARRSGLQTAAAKQSLAELRSSAAMNIFRSIALPYFASGWRVSQAGSLIPELHAGGQGAGSRRGRTRPRLSPPRRVLSSVLAQTHRAIAMPLRSGGFYLITLSDSSPKTRNRKTHAVPSDSSFSAISHDRAKNTHKPHALFSQLSEKHESYKSLRA
jgi:hypothetical protein